MLPRTSRVAFAAAGVAAITLLGGVGIATAQNAATGTPVSTCTNPTLNTNLDGWGRITGTAPFRYPLWGTAGEHASAPAAYVQANNAGGNPKAWLPQAPVRAGEAQTFAVDVRTDVPGQARMEVDWYSGTGIYLGHTDGPWGVLPGTSATTWHTVSAEFTPPANAARANVLVGSQLPGGADFSLTGCSYLPAGTDEPTEPPVTDEPDPTEPPVTDEPDPTEPPADEPVTAEAAVVDADSAKVDWQTTRTDITGWHIGRDGTDTSGYGAWSTDLPATARTFTFDLLRAGDTYTFTLTPKTAAGNLDPLTTQVTMGGEPDPTDPPTNPPGEGDTAAEVHGWGTPLPASDEFNYVGAPDPGKWGVYNGPGHDGNGTRDPNRVTVDGNKLVMTGLANGASAGMASSFDQQYGRWEARVRSMSANPGAGRQYHPLLIIWPQSNQWPDHGEYDFLENGAPGEQCAEAFLHYPGHTPIRQEHAVETNCGAPLSEWHNVALEWDAGSLTGYIDGQEWFDFGEHDMTAMPSGHLTIQLDNFFGGNMTPATYEVDWVRIYAP